MADPTNSILLCSYHAKMWQCVATLASSPSLSWTIFNSSIGHECYPFAFCHANGQLSMSQTSLAHRWGINYHNLSWGPLTILIILEFQQGSRALTLHILPCEWLAPILWTFLAHRWGMNPPTLAFGILPLIGNQW